MENLSKVIPIIAEKTSGQLYFELGLKRQEPPVSLDLRYLNQYEKGFVTGIMEDFDLPVLRLEVPAVRETYEAFLSGLGGVEFPGLSGEITRPIYDRPRLDRAYDLGLKLLLLHLDYPQEEIESRRIYARSNPRLLERYRQEAEALRSVQAQTVE